MGEVADDRAPHSQLNPPCIAEDITPAASSRMALVRRSAATREHRFAPGTFDAQMMRHPSDTDIMEIIHRFTAARTGHLMLELEAR